MLTAGVLIWALTAATAAGVKDSQPPAGDSDEAWEKIAAHFKPPAEHAGKLGEYRSPLLFNDGSPVKTPEDWQRRRQEIRDHWHAVTGAWPPVIEKPKLEYVETAKREDFTQHKVRVQVAPEHLVDGYLLVPEGEGPFPAVVVPFYEPETSVGLKQSPMLDFAYQLTKRGFVTLSIGGPGGEPTDPGPDGRLLQPLSYCGYVAANCHSALAALPQVDPKRIGVIGHSYGGKWALFASCFYDKFAAACWSDPGIVWDEQRANVNYWEPWYLGREQGVTRKPGIPTKDNRRTGAYKTLVETGHDLHELHALMAPRPFLVSGGSEDPPERWIPLNHTVAVNKLLGHENRVGMTNREGHNPTPESNEAIYAFFEHFLGRR